MAFEINNTITDLDLSWNHLRLDGAVAFARGLGWNTGIVSLNLSFNGFADLGAASMGKALARNETLEWLDLSYNRITDKGAKALSQGLAKNTCLKSMNVGYNPITKEGGRFLLVAARKSQQLVELSLEDIYLDAKAVSIIPQNMSVTYKGVARDTGNRQPARDLAEMKGEIFKIIQQYLKDNNLRMLDLFNIWDRDKSQSLTFDEFVLGCKKAKIPLTAEMVEVLMKTLDTNENGQIEYQEFVAVSKLV